MLVFNLSRLCRSTKDAALYWKFLRKHGVDLHSVNEGKVDLSVYNAISEAIEKTVTSCLPALHTSRTDSNRHDTKKFFEIPQKMCCRVLDIRVANIVEAHLPDARVRKDAVQLLPAVGRVQRRVGDDRRGEDPSGIILLPICFEDLRHGLRQNNRPYGALGFRFCDPKLSFVAGHLPADAEFPGAIKKWTQSKSKDAVFKEYRREYKRRFSWIRAGRISEAWFYNWSAEARKKKAKCDSGEITFEEFKEWLGRP